MMILPALALSLASLGAIGMSAGDCVVVAPLDGAGWTIEGSNGECGRRTLPASTFKIPHALIALQTRVVTDKTVIAWDGTTRDYSAWNRDQTLESAIRMSAVWVFQRFATAIGRERELDYLRAFRYGSAAFEHEVTNFWLNGDLRISPAEEVAFLRRMFSYDLPVDRRHIDTVKADLTMPRGTFENAAGVHDFALRWPADTVVRVKSGNGAVNGERVSWLVGALETGGRQYVFASRVRTSAPMLDTTAGADLALRVLNAANPPALRQGPAADEAIRSGRAVSGRP